MALAGASDWSVRERKPYVSGGSGAGGRVRLECERGSLTSLEEVALVGASDWCVREEALRLWRKWCWRARQTGVCERKPYVSRGSGAGGRVRLVCERGSLTSLEEVALAGASDWSVREEALRLWRKWRWRARQTGCERGSLTSLEEVALAGASDWCVREEALRLWRKWRWRARQTGV